MDEELEHDIRSFMDVILEEEDEEEYTDYRRYFTYDMRIFTNQGDEEIETDLSRKQGSVNDLKVIFFKISHHLFDPFSGQRRKGFVNKCQPHTAITLGITLHQACSQYNKIRCLLLSVTGRALLSGKIRLYLLISLIRKNGTA